MKTTRRQIIKYLNPFSKEKVTSFDIVAKGDTDKEKKLLLLFLRIVHILCLITIPSAIIGLIFILSSRNIVPNTLSELRVISAVFFYIISFTMVFIGYKHQKLSRWFAKYLNKLVLVELVLPPEYHDYMTVLSTHMFRIIVFFEIIVLIGLMVGMIIENIYPAIPLFVLATVALILTYPTNRRLEQWLSKLDVSQRGTREWDIPANSA